ncbi:hypothetical protein H4R19_004484 [Coemansia spiralis]|nr:hypothetical protein H4R19_004484 [Coemansia spiralis]
MLDHLLGKPSANVRRMQVLGTALLTLLVVRRQRAPWALGWLRRWDQRVSMWKAFLGWSTLLYLLRHMDDLLGLNAPEPLREYYSRSFYRATWAFTALDAGFWTAMTIRPLWLRHIMSLLFSVYYLVYTNRAVEKVRKVRALITIDHLRVSWNKGVDNPLLRLVRRLHSCRLSVDRVVRVPGADSPSPASSSGRLSEIADLEPAKCHVMFAGEASAFASCRSIVLNYPGGGFVAMGPECHSDYLSAWAAKTGAVVVSVDYAKAPEYPYPYAIDQCYEVYREIVQTDGRCIGLEPDGRPLRIVLAGDSAGGNITASVMFRILEAGDALQLPEGIVFIYGCFNVDIRAWMTKDETRALLGASDHVPAESTQLHRSLSSLIDTRDHLHHVSPLAITNRDDGYQRQRTRKPGKQQLYVEDRVRVVRKPAARGVPADTSDSTVVEGERATGYLPLTMTSSFTYFNDQVLSPEMMRAMIIMYIGPAGRPNFRTDYYLSPLVAPDHLLARFPPVYFMCGEKDPMVDDTVLFAARIRTAKQRAAEKDASAASTSAADGGSRLQRSPSRHAMAVGEYGKYKSSRLYSRRHSQPRPRRVSTQFYIGSTDVSEDECGGKGALPASLRMTNIPPDTGSASETRAARTQAAAIIKVKLVAGMSHGFMQMYSVLPESKRVASILADWLGEMLRGAHTITPYSRCASVVDASSGADLRRCRHTPGDISQTDDDECDANGHTWAVHASVAGHLKHRRRISPRATGALPPSLSVEGTPVPLGRSIFAGGPVDKHGIEVVSAANMVRRRGYGLADPLN